jgi:hypothetical protein
MPISQLAAPCWVTDPDLPANGEERHYDGKADAKRAIREARKNGHAVPATTIRLLESPCWVIRCDGECDALIDEYDEGYIVHSETRAAAELLMRNCGWAYLGDTDVVCCEPDRPEDAEPPLSLRPQVRLRLPGITAQ